MSFQILYMPMKSDSKSGTICDDSHLQREKGLLQHTGECPNLIYVRLIDK